ncbi:uncharacterized protein LOC120695533 [Panicum virgatum]|uniref:DUF4220 domain-containing protein n=1 Tax=Panicum virgatum TaxID=38727 RepID=A0A8T0XDV6_PANVG|nr:uncharacterized protein LOC120695533 [Panicum virgatum]KAG2657344.1 hypothetical protein PVAP13_1KG143000 [Panicum virgatum]KAG2657345.1 hypothetical protein PVAP13_1KG143000 [Panicum virgatum]KAG2657346.1 hypothetical protein PVAP13_1KG143000 [Panicum virgatum]KAG2657347.1 hypothetical protein PVAP13_1KG143000 [Panicum virgatum]KAG2657348.1 hypothetical protein PVAP13_1KG143000 [Panicum virgatum]
MNFTMEGLVELWSKWEIQLVVLLSFTLQIFLFFGGGIRRYYTNTILRLSIWLAYVGADMVAVYALGLISKNDENAATSVGCHGIKNPNDIDSSHNQLAFFWAPFLLIHLGGQDTMTAFSVEDNNLWLRHLLNLSIQVFLALYAFWKSTGRHNLKILAPAILVFLAGIIRYGERTWALKCGSRDGLRETSWQLQKLNVEVDKGTYVGTVFYGLSSMPGVRDLFSGRNVSQMKVREVFKFQADRPLDQVLKLLEVELAMMYDDLYTKAMVLRTTSGIILRCISQISIISAFVLFIIANSKQYSSRADAAITYALFIGGFGLESCAVVLMVMSPWTWAFFKARKNEMLAHVTWLLLSGSIGWPEKRILWSNSMGQYNFLSSCIVLHQPRTSSKVLIFFRKVLSSVEKKFFVRKLRHTKHVQVNKDIMENVVTWVQRVAREEFTRQTEQQHWSHIRPIIKATLNSAANSFGDNIILLHTYTELHLRKRPNDEVISTNGTVASINTIMDTCRKISNYMVYLLVVQPSMLPLSGTAEDTLAEFYEKVIRNNSSSKQDVLDTAYQLVENILEFGDEECLKEQEEPGLWCETLIETRDVWMRLLIFAAGKCPVDLHAKQLGRGGELLTFVWLLMAHCGIGDVAHQVDLISSNNVMSGQFCAFHFPSEAEQSSA